MMAEHRRIKTSRYKTMIRAAERQILQSALEFTETVTAAAKYLGVDRAYLYRRMEMVGLHEKAEIVDEIPEISNEIPAETEPESTPAPWETSWDDGYPRPPGPRLVPEPEESENKDDVTGQLQPEAAGGGEPDVVDDHGDGPALAEDERPGS